jgi:hypothetical protein
MVQINVKLLKVYAGALGGDDSVHVSVYLNKETGDKYFSFTIFGSDATTQIYQYPEINPIVYSVIDYIEKCGESRIEGGSVYGPHLLRKRNKNQNGGYALFDVLHDGEMFILEGDIISKDMPICDQEWFENLVR